MTPVASAQPIGALTTLVQYGPFGVSVAMLLLGFYFYSQAIKAPQAKMESSMKLAKQFMIFAVVLFVLASVADVFKGRYSKNELVALVSVPPLSEEDTESLGKVLISVKDSDNKLEPVLAKSEPCEFSIHDRAVFTINLEKICTQLRTKLLLEKMLVKSTTPKTGAAALGPEGLQ